MSNREIHDRGFDQFSLGEDPRSYGNGVVYEIADTVGVDISSGEPNVDALKALCKATRNALAVDIDEGILCSDEIPFDQALEWAHRTGLTSEISRTFFNDAVPVPYMRRLVGGDSPNAMDKAIKTLAKRNAKYEIILLASRRLMHNIVDFSNPNVQDYYARNGQFPTEAQYTGYYVIPQLHARSGVIFDLIRPQSADPVRAVYDSFSDANLPGGNDTLGNDLTCHMGEGLSVALACRVRTAARVANPRYDSDYGLPSLYITANAERLPEQVEQLEDPRYVNPYAIVHSAVYTAYHMALSGLHKQKNPLFD